MPSATFALMDGWHQESARTNGPVSLASEREGWTRSPACTSHWRESPTHEEVAELRPGSWLLTPQAPPKTLSSSTCTGAASGSDPLPGRAPWALKWRWPQARACCFPRIPSRAREPLPRRPG